MKKLSAILSLILALMIGMGCMTTAAAEMEFVDFTPELTNIFEFSMEEWMESDVSRAMATVCLYLDLSILDSFEYEMELFETSYIGYSEGGISVVLQTSDASKCIIILYHPGLQQASYAVCDVYGSFETQLTAMITQVCTKHYTNSTTALMQVVEMLSSALSD